MDDSHARIFGQPHVNGHKIIALYEAFQAALVGLEDIEDKPFAAYNLTKFFMCFVVSQIFRTSNRGKAVLHNPKVLFEYNAVKEFAQVFENLSQTVALDLNAEIEDVLNEGKLDYKASLKNAKWCDNMSRTLVSSYLKDVKRKKRNQSRICCRLSIDVCVGEVVGRVTTSESSPSKRGLYLSSR